MASASEDDFQQFLDMSGMSNISDSMQFDFAGFQGSGPAQQAMNQARDHPDTIMDLGGGASNANMVSRAAALPSNSQQPRQQAMNGQIVGAVPGSSDAISSIDAQIQYLQRQKFEQQQRQIQEQQRSAFFSGGGGHHSIPPTPQSFEMHPGSGQFYSQAEIPRQQGVYDGGYSRHGTDAQDVSLSF